MEMLIPILLFFGPVWAKHRCGDTCIGLTVGGWGGFIPPSDVQSGVIDCVDGVNGASCDNWIKHHDQATSFADVITCMQMQATSFALVADRCRRALRPVASCSALPCPRWRFACRHGISYLRHDLCCICRAAPMMPPSSTT